MRNLSKTRRGLKDHIRLHHEEQVELECQKCEKKFGNEVHLRAHYQQSHRTQNNSFVCDSCGKSFKLKQSLKMHCLSEHSNEEDQEKYKFNVIPRAVTLHHCKKEPLRNTLKGSI